MPGDSTLARRRPRALGPRRGSWLTAWLIALAPAVVSPGCKQLSTRGEARPHEALAPDFTLPSHDGSRVTLSSLLPAGPVVIVFYRGFWCTRCARQLGELAALRQRVPTLSVVAISIDPAEASTTLARDLHIDFPLLRDADLAVARAYGVVMVGEDLAAPAVFVVRRDGHIHYAKVAEDVADRPSAEVVLAAVNDADDHAPP